MYFLGHSEKESAAAFSRNSQKVEAANSLCVKMWGTSSHDDKLTGNLGNVIEATRIGGRRSDRLMAVKLTPGNFGLLQQYLPIADSCTAANSSLSAKAGQPGHEAARTPLVHKTEHARDNRLRLETIITRRATPRDVLVRPHQHEPASVNRDELRLIEP
jgi:hypothetical protein